MTIDRHVEELLKRTGIGEQLAKEAEESRAAAYADAVKRKAARVARFRADRPKAEALVTAAAEKAEAARRALDASIEELIKVRARLEQVLGDFTIDRDRLDAELRKHTHPAVDVLEAELKARQQQPTDGFDSHEARSRYGRFLADLLDELGRVRIGGELGEVTDQAAAVQALRDKGGAGQ